ncbi:MAG: penicillin-binding protein 1C [Bacteroidota bacterium]
MLSNSRIALTFDNNMSKRRKFYHFFFKTHPRKTWGVLFLLGFAYWWALPKPLFTDPTCMVLEDRSGQLLGARIAEDGQWRFPPNDTVPHKFVEALTEFEDRRFFQHPGIDPMGIARALRQNFQAGKIVSGGSTLSMQTIRMARKGQSRTIGQKLIEALLATRLELRYSKAQILALYASHAPFGGNVVGLDAASWRYFGKNASQLSWAEAATLAVLPNSPGLIHPGRNRAALLAKRNRLIDRLVQSKKIDAFDGELAKEEPLPQKPLALPRLAPHLLDRAFREHFSQQAQPITRLQSTIDRSLQEQCAAILQRHQQNLRGNGIHNLAALIIHVESGAVLAYVGNSPGAGKEHGEAVDIITAARSTGSILKPFLYALALDDGSILPNSLLPDVPTSLNGYRPENFHEAYDGMVSAERSLVRSLNIPMVHLLQQYGLEKFHFGLQKLGLQTIHQPAQHYGLSLILGGAEASLWDLCNAYSGMSRSLGHFYDQDGAYDPQDFRAAHYALEAAPTPSPRSAWLSEAPVLSAAASWLTLEAMQALARPNSLGEWERFQSSQRIAWKTGTSFGFRDAWAIGTTPEYTVGVWVGNADGEGRPGLVGVQAAGPVLFDLFDLLPASTWFSPPYDEMVSLPSCRQSGYRALPGLCPVDSVWGTLQGAYTKPCPHHQLIHLDASEQWRVNSDCESPSTMQHRPWFVLPPVEEYYYKSKNPSYVPLPPFRADCSSLEDQQNPMQLIYPPHATTIYVPLDLDGSPSRTIFKVVHRKPKARIFWHLDETYIGRTENFHEMALHPSVGPHQLTLVDEAGFRLEQYFEIIQK